MKVQKPASFMLINSKGFPDFVMTMLVVVIIALLLVIVFWMGFNLAVLNNQSLITTEGNNFSEFMKSFNDNAQVIILGLCSSVFTLAGTYYLRRSSHDKNFTEREKIHIENKVPGGIGVAGMLGGLVSGFVDNKETTLHHPNYDDEEEDI